MKSKHWTGRLFDGLNYAVLGLLALSTLYPFWATLVISVSPLEVYLRETYYLFPKAVNLSTYAFIFGMKEFWRAYGMTIFVTAAGTSISMLTTLISAYALSKTDLKGVREVTWLVLFTMFFGGGIIPTFILYKQMGIVNTPWALILPKAVLTHNLVILKNYFKSIPASLEESAKLDGCNDFRVLFQIVAPVSYATLSVITLFYAVSHWNEFFAAVMYISDRKYWTLQLYLQSMLYENEAAYQTGSDPSLLGMPIKMAAVMASVLPIVCAYPVLQRFFVKGVMGGAVKA